MLVFETFLIFCQISSQKSRAFILPRVIYETVYVYCQQPWVSPLFLIFINLINKETSLFCSLLVRLNIFFSFIFFFELSIPIKCPLSSALWIYEIKLLITPWNAKGQTQILETIIILSKDCHCLLCHHYLAIRFLQITTSLNRFPVDCHSFISFSKVLRFWNFIFFHLMKSHAPYFKYRCLGI